MGNINFGNGNEEAGSVFTGEFGGQQNNIGGQQGPKEDAGSIAGAMQPPVGMGGYVGGFVGAGQVSGYAANGMQEARAELPVKPSLWTRFKAFLFQEVDLTQEISIELSAKEEKVLSEVHDFLFQELSFKGFMNILKIGNDKK